MIQLLLRTPRRQHNSDQQNLNPGKRGRYCLTSRWYNYVLGHFTVAWSFLALSDELAVLRNQYIVLTKVRQVGIVVEYVVLKNCKLLSSPDKLVHSFESTGLMWSTSGCVIVLQQLSSLAFVLTVP